MNGNKKARGTAATVTQARTEQTTGRASFSTNYFTTSPRECQGVVALLSPGRENGRHVADLATALRCDNRELRRRVQAARKAGALILSDVRAGYFLPDDVNDIRRFVRTMRHRCAEISAATAAAERALDAATGQERIEGWWTV